MLIANVDSSPIRFRAGYNRRHVGRRLEARNVLQKMEHPAVQVCKY